MAIKMLSEYGPVVYCPATCDYESTHRPTGSSDPWFCMACGGTGHEPLVETMTPYRSGDHCRILSSGKQPRVEHWDCDEYPDGTVTNPMTGEIIPKEN